ncbi:MAG: DUF6565 domain-containing protein [Marinifilaceae bacterium]
MLKRILVLALSVLLFVACESKDTYMTDFRDFVTQIQEENEEFTEKDWKKAEKKFMQLSDKDYAKYKEQLSTIERAEVIKLRTTYVTLRAKSGFKNLGKEIEDLGGKADEWLKEQNKK